MAASRRSGGSSQGVEAIFAAVAAGVAVGASLATAAAFLWVRRREAERKEQGGGASGQVLDSDQSLRGEGDALFYPISPTERGKRFRENSWLEADMTPPLPKDVVRLLCASSLCFLSTFCDDHPHLSLMNFTYYADDEVIILSTRRDTKKYQLVQKARHVAILVHEFPYTPGTVGFQNGAGNGSGDGGGDVGNGGNSSDVGNGSGDAGDGGGGDGPLSPLPSSRPRNSKVTITLNGSAKIEEGAQAEKYRELHAKHNPESKTFIVGPNIAIITVRVRTARICNIRDEVKFWDIADPTEITMPLAD